MRVPSAIPIDNRGSDKKISNRGLYMNIHIRRFALKCDSFAIKSDMILSCLTVLIIIQENNCNESFESLKILYLSF